MTRRKKLLRLGLVPKKVKTKAQRKHEQMLKDICERVKKRKKDPKVQEAERNEWLQKYASNFTKTDLALRETWANGTTAKKDIFAPVQLDQLDLEEINAKRKENNIELPIEKAATLALEEMKEKAKRVAVICHKSGYQYIGDKEDAKNFGKKSQEMETHHE